MMWTNLVLSDTYIGREIERIVDRQLVDSVFQCAKSGDAKASDGRPVPLLGLLQPTEIP